MAERNVTVDVVTAGADTTPASLLEVEGHGGAQSVPGAESPHRYSSGGDVGHGELGALLPFLEVDQLPAVVSLSDSDVPGYNPYDRVLQHVHRLALLLIRWIWRRAERVVRASRAAPLAELPTSTW